MNAGSNTDALRQIRETHKLSKVIKRVKTILHTDVRVCKTNDTVLLQRVLGNV